MPGHHATEENKGLIFIDLHRRCVELKRRQEIAPNKLLKTKGQNKKDVKNEGCSQYIDENKEPKKVLPMSS